MRYHNTPRDNKLWYLSKVDKFGWWLEILPFLAFLDIGHVKTPPEGPQDSYTDYWYIDYRFPFGEWHSLNTSKAFRRKAVR